MQGNKIIPEEDIISTYSGMYELRVVSDLVSAIIQASHCLLRHNRASTTCAFLCNETLSCMHGVIGLAVIDTSVNKAVRQSPDLLFIATSFWFEESPCAVRTNTAGLGRLCTLFVCSTLLVFEHTHAVLSSTLVLCCTMVTTSTAAMSNSRYADTDRMKNVFLIRFSKPHMDRAKAGR